MDTHTDATRRHKLARLASRIDQLPLLPEAVVNLLRLDSRADDYFDRVAQLIRSDPAFAMRLLRHANSALFCPARPVATIEKALMIVGCTGAVGLVVGHSTLRIFVPSHDWERDLWRHAFDVACLMQAFAERRADTWLQPQQAYLYGLLHDIGRFILYLEAPEDLRAVDETRWATPEALVEAESAICGFTHTELGYLAIRKWRMSDELADVVRHHHLLAGNAAAGTLEPVVRLLGFTDRLSMAFAVNKGWWHSLPDDALCRWLDDHGYPGRCAFNRGEDLALARQALTRSAQMQRQLGIGATTGHPTVPE